MSQRAKHPSESLHLLHGSLFDVKCTSFWCPYLEKDNFTDPIVPALALPVDESDPTSDDARNRAISDALVEKEAEHSTAEPRELDISDASVKLPELAIKDLPHCPSCQQGLLRPGVVWFGEMLPEKTIQAIDTWIEDSEEIDLIIVIGTSARVYPAAGYVDRARAKGARVAVVNMDRDDIPAAGLTDNDWLFHGDAAVILPEILKSVVGEVTVPEKL